PVFMTGCASLASSVTGVSARAAKAERKSPAARMADAVVVRNVMVRLPERPESPRAWFRPDLAKLRTHGVGGWPIASGTFAYSVSDRPVPRYCLFRLHLQVQFPDFGAVAIEIVLNELRVVRRTVFLQLNTQRCHALGHARFAQRLGD